MIYLVLISTAWATQLGEQAETVIPMHEFFALEKFRMRSFTEVMTPAIANNDGISMPFADGSHFLPLNAFQIFWMDYEIAPRLRVLYYQRLILTLGSNEVSTPGYVSPRPPRFALRFILPDTESSIDVYFQPPISVYMTERKRAFEVGGRISLIQRIPPVSYGFTTDITLPYAYAANTSADFYGFSSAWASFALSETISTQHWISFPFEHIGCTQQWGWDIPLQPYIQNGLGFNVSRILWLGIMLNTYFLTPPTLRNSWASLWVSLDLMPPYSRK